MTENVTQAFARDVFAHGILDIAEKGIDVLWHVHDEVICEVDQDVSDEEALAEVNESLTKCPEWCEGLPLEAEGAIKYQYEK